MNKSLLLTVLSLLAFESDAMASNDSGTDFYGQSEYGYARYFLNVDENGDRFSYSDIDSSFGSNVDELSYVDSVQRRRIEALMDKWKLENRKRPRAKIEDLMVEWKRKLSSEVASSDGELDTEECASDDVDSSAQVGIALLTALKRERDEENSREERQDLEVIGPQMLAMLNDELSQSVSSEFSDASSQGDLFPSNAKRSKSSDEL